MKIKTLRLTNFMSTDKLELEFPPAGVLLITGPNGVGKSTLVEAVSYGLWGKAVRDIPHPWREGVAGSVEVEADAPAVRAARTSGKSGKRALAWSAGEQAAETFESPTKAAEAFSSLIGDWDIWRRSHVFSSSDAAHFTLATDKERKQLLETILGLDRFDPALDEVRGTLRIASRAVQTAETLLLDLTAKLENETRAQTEAKEALEAAPPAPDFAADASQLRELDRLIKGAEAEVQALRRNLREQEQAGGGNESDLRHVEAKLAQLRSALCPTCAQPVPPALLIKLSSEAGTIRKGLAEGKAKLAALLETIDEEIAGVEEDIQALRSKRVRIAGAAEAAAGARRQRDKLEAMLARAQGALRGLDEKIMAARLDLGEKTVLARRLGYAEAALGLRGVRSTVLGQTLSGLEQVANSWLARIAGPDLRLGLQSFEEKKTGGVKDAIALTTSGVGGGHGYGGASGGERRRIDIAMLLAIAEVASAASGRAGGTLFFDEALDHVDESGADAICAAIGQLAADRCVVVITHSPALMDRLSVARHLYLVRDASAVAK